MKKIEVRASKTYEVLIGAGLLKDAGELIKEVPAISESLDSAVIVVDDTVNALYGGQVEASLVKAGLKVHKYVFPHGEQSKSFELYERLLNFMADIPLTRSDLLLALGGGVAGDLGGFAAATYMRGIKLVQIPTTLIAMSDSSVGGKTAIDLEKGKNLCGSFYQPDLVICDTDTAETLPPTTFRDGCAEIIKYGLIGDPALLRHLEKKGMDFDRDYVISSCVEMKKDIVDKDELDLGIRRLLNLGHTVGHALEALSGYSLSHGHAVAKGIAVMAIASAEAGICPNGASKKIISLLQKFGFDLNLTYDFDEIMSGVLSDKKRRGNKLSWVVPEDYGKCGLRNGSIDDFAAFIRPGVEKWK